MFILRPIVFHSIHTTIVIAPFVTHWHLWYLILKFILTAFAFQVGLHITLVVQINLLTTKRNIWVVREGNFLVGASLCLSFGSRIVTLPCLIVIVWVIFQVRGDRYNPQSQNKSGLRQHSGRSSILTVIIRPFWMALDGFLQNKRKKIFYKFMTSNRWLWRCSSCTILYSVLIPKCKYRRWY